MYAVQPHINPWQYSLVDEILISVVIVLRYVCVPNHILHNKCILAMLILVARFVLCSLAIASGSREEIDYRKMIGSLSFSTV